LTTIQKESNIVIYNFLKNNTKISTINLSYMKHYNTLMNKMKSNYIVDFFNKYEKKNVGYIKNTIMPRYIEMEK